MALNSFFKHIFSPRSLIPDATRMVRVHFKHFAFKHFACLIVHPVTGETISSYKKLMHDPAMVKVWQMVFGKDSNGRMQGKNKMGQKGTDAMFVKTHDNSKRVLADSQKLTYENPVVDYCPRKRIHIAFASHLTVT
jgi:hypothetical protein